MLILKPLCDTHGFRIVPSLPRWVKCLIVLKRLVKVLVLISYAPYNITVLSQTIYNHKQTSQIDNI